MQVSEAVQSQTLNIETDLELERGGLDQCLSKQPAVLLACNSTGMYKHIRSDIREGEEGEYRNNKQKPKLAFSPLTSFKERIVTQATVSSCRFIELRPPRLDQRLCLYATLALLVTWLNQHDLQTVELLDEGKRFLELSLALRNLQRAVQ